MKLSLMTIIWASIVVAQTTQFKSLCFSDVCLGDGVNKISGLKLGWLSEEHPRKQPPSRPGMASHQGAPRPRPVNPQNLKDVRREFRGLTESDYSALASAIHMGPTGDQDINILLPQTDLTRFEINNITLPILKRATTVCTALPIVFGIFRSESGHYTGVVLAPENGKLKVVKMSRRWMPSFPENATYEQKAQIAAQQLNELKKQIPEVYGGDWNMDAGLDGGGNKDRSVTGDGAVAYFSTKDFTHPALGFYDIAFHQYFVNKAEKDPWEYVVMGYERALANIPGCAVLKPAFKIN